MKKNSSESRQGHSHSERIQFPSDPLAEGFVFRPDAARFLRTLAEHVSSVVDGRRMKITVDIQMEKQ